MKSIIHSKEIAWEDQDPTYQGASVSSRADCDRPHGTGLTFSWFHLLLGTLFFTSLIGCAGFKGGYMSLPYIGDDPPKLPVLTTPHQLLGLDHIGLPDLNLSLSLNNSIQTYHFLVILYVIPVYIDLKEHRWDSRYGWGSYNPPETGEKLALKMSIRFMRPGISFDLRQVQITVDGQTYPATSMWPTYDVTKDSSTERDAPIHLNEMEKLYSITVQFDTGIPTPDQAIALDLSKAIKTPHQDPIPIIHFQKLRWRGGYT